MPVLQVEEAIKGQYDAGPEASHRVIHEDGDRETFLKLRKTFATMYVGVLFARETKNRGMLAQLVKQLASPTNVNSSSRGYYFEVLVHAAISSGGLFEYKFCDVPCSVPASGTSGKPSRKRTSTLLAALDAATTEAAVAAGATSGEPLRLTVPHLEERVFTAGSPTSIGDFGAATDKCVSPSYLLPNGISHPVIDACIYPDTLLQITVASEKEGFNEEVLERHLQCLPDLERYYLDFVVPPDKFHNFKAAPLKRASDHTRIAKTFVRVVRVEAKLPPSVHAPTRMAKCTPIRGARMMAR